MKKWHTGVIIGKFLPPHHGHKFFIETAASQVDELTVFVCGHHDDFIDVVVRARWLREIHPNVRILSVYDIYDDDANSPLWANLTMTWLGYKPDVAFTSEDYGERWAKEMGSDHVLVDFERKKVPMSGTKVRAAPLENWDYIEPVVRAHYARRICVLGAESTGSTTLAEALAERYQTNWVPEYGREYCEKYWDGLDYVWKSEEFTVIAREQTRRENEAAKWCNKVLICDTNAFATRLWHERYMGFFSPAVDEIVDQTPKPVLYVLTDIDIPFVQDGIRDGEHIRAQMHARFIEELEKQDVPWILVSGTIEERIAQVEAKANLWS